MANDNKKVLENEDLKKEIQAILDEAKAEAKRIVEGAKASVSGELSPEEKEKRKKQADYMEELVEVELFKDNGKYSDDLYVSVNGDNCVIKRGEPVMVKRKFKAVIDQGKRQDQLTSRLIEEAKKVKKIADL